MVLEISFDNISDSVINKHTLSLSAGIMDMGPMNWLGSLVVVQTSHSVCNETRSLGQVLNYLEIRARSCAVATRAHVKLVTWGMTSNDIGNII